MGETKIQQAELGELTKAIQKNPFIQEVKMNERHMSRKAKDLMKSELAKNQEIQRYGMNAHVDTEHRGTQKELKLTD